jgi:hypothetical protein
MSGEQPPESNRASPCEDIVTKIKRALDWLHQEVEKHRELSKELHCDTHKPKSGDEQ